MLSSCKYDIIIFTTDLLNSNLKSLEQNAYIYFKTNLSSLTECSDPGLTGTTNYGNGLLLFTEKEFCADGVCNDVSVCEVVNDAGDSNYYLPIDGPSNIAKDLVHRIKVFPTNILSSAVKK